MNYIEPIGICGKYKETEEVAKSWEKNYDNSNFRRIYHASTLSLTYAVLNGPCGLASANITDKKETCEKNVLCVYFFIGKNSDDINDNNNFILIPIREFMKPLLFQDILRSNIISYFWYSLINEGRMYHGIPIFAASEEQVSGTCTFDANSLKILDTKFSSFDELKKFAMKVKKHKQEYSYVAGDVVNGEKDTFCAEHLIRFGGTPYCVKLFVDARAKRFPNMKIYELNGEAYVIRGQSFIPVSSNDDETSYPYIKEKTIRSLMTPEVEKRLTSARKVRRFARRTYNEQNSRI